MIYISIGFLIIEKAETFYSLSLVKLGIICWLVFPAHIIPIRMESDFVVRINKHDILPCIVKGCAVKRKPKTKGLQPFSSTVAQHPRKGFTAHRFYSGLEQEQPFVPLISSGILVVHLKLVSSLNYKGIIQSANSSINNVHIVPLSAALISSMCFRLSPDCIIIIHPQRQYVNTFSKIFFKKFFLLNYPVLFTRIILYLYIIYNTLFQI